MAPSKLKRKGVTVSLDVSLTKAMAQIPECVAAGYVDMATGMLLGVKTVDSHPQDVLDLVSAATADLFQGANVTAIEKMFRKARGHSEDGNHYFQEIIVFSTNLIHVFLRSKKAPSQACVFVCRSAANIGMVIVKSRGALSEVEKSV
jgi:hypothetical protein